LLAALTFGVLISIFFTAIADLPLTLDVPDGPSVLDIVLMVLRAGYCIIPYGMLAFCLATVARSTALGVVGVLIFLFGEAIALAILESIGGIAADSRDFLIGHNVSGLLAANQIGPESYVVLAPRERAIASESPDPNTAALIIAIYSAALFGIALAIFNRRDIRSFER